MRFELNPPDFNDWPSLHKLLVECFAYMDGIINPPSSIHKSTPESLRQKADKQTLLIVRDDDKIVACGYSTSVTRLYILVK